MSGDGLVTLGGTDLGFAALVFVTGVFLCAGLIKGVSGFGLPLFLVPTLSFVLPPLTMIAVIAPILVIANISQIVETRSEWDVIRETWPINVALVLSMSAALPFVGRLDQDTVFTVIGTLVGLFAVIGLSGWRLTRRPRYLKPVMAGCGTVGGLLGAMTSLYAFPSMQLLIALDMPPRRFLFALNFMFLVGAAVLALGYAGHGHLGRAELAFSLVAAIPLLIGQGTGMLIRKRFSAERFRKVVLVLMLALALSLLERGLFE